MAKIRKIDSSVWEKWAKKSIFGQKTAKKSKSKKNFGKYFFHFLKDQEISSYGKNQENL